jgi:Na+-driven multidrug efflux pump
MRSARNAAAQTVLWQGPIQAASACREKTFIGAEMADLGAAEIAVGGPPVETPRARLSPAKNPILDGPILSTLLKLAAPNIVAQTAGICVVVAETSYVGYLGTAPLAAMALMFPVIILMMTTSGGAMGGGVASAISRALGAGDTKRASALAIHALTIGVSFGATLSVLLLTSGHYLLSAMGGRARVLDEALAFSSVWFAGVMLIWLMNTLVAILRGTGNMNLPSAIVFSSALCQIVVGGSLSLGLAGMPQLGIRGIAIGQLTGFSTSVAIMGWYILSGRSRISLAVKNFRYRREMFADILKVGAVACFYPVQSVLTVGIFTAMLAQFGTEVLAGYGIGARLEFMLTSIAFSTGVASVPMIGMAVGAGRINRARRIAWSGAAISALGVGIVGTLIAFFPHLWVDLFTSDVHVRAASAQYLSIAGPSMGVLAVGISLYFSSQGAAKVLGSVIAQSARLIFVVAAGWWLTMTGAAYPSFFMLAGGAMVVFGLLTALTVRATSWGSELTPKVAAA